MDWMPQAVRDGIIVVLVISGPLVMAAAFIGLVVGVLQAATQVQEQTIGSALKIIGVFAIIIFAGFWMYQYLNQYTSKSISSAFTSVTRQTQKAVPPNAFSGMEDMGGFKENFGNRINAANQPLEVIKPEKIEEKLPQGGLPPSGYLGAPEIPKPPAVKKVLPPPEFPKVPARVVKPEIPLSKFQEPKTIEPLKPEGIQTDIDKQIDNINIEKLKEQENKNENTKTDMNTEGGEGNENIPSWLN